MQCHGTRPSVLKIMRRRNFRGLALPRFLADPTWGADLFKKNEVATVAGLAGMCGNIGLLLFSLLIGVLVSVVGYEPFFIGLAVLDLLGAVVLWSVVRAPQTSVSRSPLAAPIA